MGGRVQYCEYSAALQTEISSFSPLATTHGRNRKIHYGAVCLSRRAVRFGHEREAKVLVMNHYCDLISTHGFSYCWNMTSTTILSHFLMATKTCLDGVQDYAIMLKIKV